MHSELGHKAYKVESADDLHKPFVSMYFGAAYLAWLSEYEGRWVVFWKIHSEELDRILHFSTEVRLSLTCACFDDNEPGKEPPSLLFKHILVAQRM